MKVNSLKSYRVKMMMYTLLCMIITFAFDIIAIYIYKHIKHIANVQSKAIPESVTAQGALPRTYVNNSHISNAISSNQGMRDLPFFLVLVCLSFVLFILLFQLFTRKTVNYLHEITGAIQKISDGDFNTRLEVVGDDEFSIIADNINRMAMDLEFLKAKENEAEETKNELITNVAHDLRTPLTSILGYLDIVNTHTGLTEEQKKNYTQIAYNKALRLQGMIEDLFSFTKLSYGKMPLKKQPLDIVKLLQQETDEFYPNFEDNRLSCEFKTDSPSCMIMADGSLIARAFENLIGNAIKYGRDGKIIKINIHHSDKYVTISIVNYGNVIPQKDLPFIFDKFYRVDQARQEQTGGTGLGLSIAKAIIENHGGTIKAESSLSGTVFEVTLNLMNEEG